MFRKYLVPVLLVVQVLCFSCSPACSCVNQRPVPGECRAARSRRKRRSPSHGQYVWSYAAKFVCGCSKRHYLRVQCRVSRS